MRSPDLFGRYRPFRPTLQVLTLTLDGLRFCSGFYQQRWRLGSVVARSPSGWSRDAGVTLASMLLDAAGVWLLAGGYVTLDWHTHRTLLFLSYSSEGGLGLFDFPRWVWRFFPPPQKKKPWPVLPFITLVGWRLDTARDGRRRGVKSVQRGGIMLPELRSAGRLRQRWAPPCTPLLTESGESDDSGGVWPLIP